tara:strand:+ start:1083 stop:1964 length:882 start_codon:yes stop_codon:yes gene_type:complete
MAFDFPSTAGQPTDGSYTITFGGIVYAWNGSSWAAAGAGASATDRSLFSVSTNSAGTPALSYSSATGAFTYTPPDLTPYLTTSNGGAGSNYDADLLDGQQGAYYTNAGNLNAGVVPSARLSGSYNISITGSASISSINDIGDVTINSASNNEVLTWNGSNWVNLPNSVTGLQTRGSAFTTQSVANATAGNFTITTPKTYALLSIQTSHAAWVTLYSSTNARSNDSSRLETTDPTPGSGVLAEVITAGAATQLITPGTVCFNEAGSNATYLKVYNKSGATNNITVTLTYVQLEA